MKRVRRRLSVGEAGHELIIPCLKGVELRMSQPTAVDAYASERIIGLSCHTNTNLSSSFPIPS